MDLTEPELLITPFSLLTSLDTSPKKSLQLHQFLKTPLPSNHLKSPTSARNHSFKRKLSDVGEPNFSTNEGSNRVLEKSDSSKNHNILPATQRPSSRFSSTSTVHSKHDRHRKFPQTSIPRKSGFSVANSDQGKKKSTLAEKIGKSLFRAQSVAVFGKLRVQLSRNSGSNKDHSIPELKILVPSNHPNDSFSLKIATGEGGSKEKTSDDSDISSPLYPSFIRNNGIYDTNIPKSSLRKRRLEKQSALLEKDKGGPVSLSNMFRRKSCHCSDCGGLSDFEKRHLNVVSPSKRAEFNKQQKPSLRSRIETTLPHLEKGLSAPEMQVVTMQIEALDEEASAEGKLSSKIMSTNFRKKSSSSPDKYLSLAKQLSFRRNTPRPEQQSKLDHSGSISPLISNSPTAAMIALNEKSQLSKGSENGGDETLTLKLTLESPKRESEALKGLNLKYSFDAESPITLRRDTNENINSRVSRGSSLIDQQPNQTVPEEKRFTKNLVLKPARNRPQKIIVYEQSPLSKRDSVIIKTTLQLPNLEKSPVLVKRSLSTRNRPNSETTIKGIYGLNNRMSSEDKSPTSRNASSCRNLKNDTQISSIDSPIKIDALILPGLPKKGHPCRQKNLSLQVKSSSKRPQLPFESQKSARSIRGPDPIDLSKGIKTDRDSSSPINKSGKVLEALRFKEMSTDASDASPRKIKGVSLGKMQIGQLMKIYKKKEKEV